MEKIKIEVLRKRIKRVINGMILELNCLHQYRADEPLSNVDYYERTLNVLEEAARLVGEYNTLDVKELVDVRACGIVEGLSGNSKIPPLVVNIQGVLRELETARDYLDAYLKVCRSKKSP